jgi:hypothetical protein
MVQYSCNKNERTNERTNSKWATMCVKRLTLALVERTRLKGNDGASDERSATYARRRRRRRRRSRQISVISRRQVSSMQQDNIPVVCWYVPYIRYIINPLKRPTNHVARPIVVTSSSTSSYRVSQEFTSHVITVRPPSQKNLAMKSWNGSCQSTQPELLTICPCLQRLVDLG